MRRSSPLNFVAWMSRPMTPRFTPETERLPPTVARNRGSAAVRPLPKAGPLVPYPQAGQAAQVRDEPVVLMGRVRRPDGLDQQIVEIRARHPVEDDLVHAGEPGRAEVLVALGLEVRLGQRPVAIQLLGVAGTRVVGDLEVLVGRHV